MSDKIQALAAVLEYGDLIEQLSSTCLPDREGPRHALELSLREAEK